MRPLGQLRQRRGELAVKFKAIANAMSFGWAEQMGG